MNILPSNRFDFRTHLLLLYKVFQYIGLSNFDFDPYTRRVEYSTTRSRISAILLYVVRAVNGSFFVCLLVFCMYMHLNLMKGRNWKGIEAQEEVILYISQAADYLGVLILSSLYLKFGKPILRIINNILDIFKCIEKQSDSTIYIQSELAVLLLFKMALSLLHVLHTTPTGLTIFFISDVTSVFGHVMQLTTFLGYVYSQLVLICFFLKMSDILHAGTFRVDQNNLTKNLRQLLGISLRIHQVKLKLNILFSGLFMSTYLGLFADIIRLYEILKILFYDKFEGDLIYRIIAFIVRLSIRLPLTLSISYDIFLLGRLSEALVQSERDFKQRIILLYCRSIIDKSPQLNQEIDQLMIRSSVYDLNSWSWRTIKMDRQFSFDFTLNIILIFAVTFLQFYASEVVYKNRVHNV